MDNGVNLSDGELLIFLFVFGLYVVKEIRSWRTESDVLKTLREISTSRDNIRVAEMRYEASGTGTQAAVQVTHSFLQGFERVLQLVLPNAKLTEAVDLAEDFTEEILDGVPIDSKIKGEPPPEA